MKSLSAIALILLAAVVLAAAGTHVVAAPGDVKTSFDIPCKYPSGLATDGKSLFLADWRKSKIYQLSTKDGALQETWSAPTLKPHGLTYGGGKLYVSDDHTGNVYALDLESGIVDNMFQAPGSRATGLAYAGDVLYILERRSSNIYKVLPEDGTILSYFPVPDRSCECLAYDGRYLWVSNRIRDELYMVEPESGMVLGILDSPGPYSSGVAWLDGHLWNVDFQNRKLYQLVIKGQEMYRLKDKREARVEYLWALSNYGPGEVKDLVLNVAIPEELPNQKILSEISFSKEPSKKAKDQWGQECAVFELGSIPAGTKKELTYSVNVQTAAIRYLIFPDETGKLKDIPREVRRMYTADGSRYRTASPYIKDTVKKIVGDEQNPYWIARKIYDFIIDRLHYEMVGGWDVPEVVLKRGSGSCSEYTFSFVSLCRAAGLPARYQGSVVVRGDDASVDEAFHRWAQVYLPGYGWVPVDANRGDSDSPVGQAKGIGELANKFLITTQGGGGSEYLGWGYNSLSHYKASGYCKVEEDNLGFWEPLAAGARLPTAIKIKSAEECWPELE